MVEYEYAWGKCPEQKHEWEAPPDSMYENEVVCKKCGMVGELEKGYNEVRVYYPAT